MLETLRRRTQPIMRFLALAGMPTLLAAIALPDLDGVSATEPEPPILILVDEKDGERGWLAHLSIDLKQAGKVQAHRQVYRDGEPLFEERLSAEEGRFDQERERLLVKIPLAFEKMRKLEDGAYAQRIRVIAVWADERETKKPIEEERWFHFLMRDGKPHRLSVKEYSRIVDPPKQDIGIGGEPLVVRVGRDRKEEISADKDERSEAMPLGRAGGIQLERPVKRKSAAREEMPVEHYDDRSEVDED